jgi:hypothetical protein
LLAFGLLGLRVMARRSVSLGLLRSLRDGVDPRPPFDARVEARIDEAVRLGWLRADGASLFATPRGRRVAAFAALLRRGLGARAR